MKNRGIGRISILFALTDNYEEMKLKYEKRGYSIIRGNAGSMDAKKILAAIEVAASREEIISDNYHDEHALYHATVEALQGYCRGQVALGEILRTAGLTYTLVKGPLFEGDEQNGRWISVVLFGEIGSPRKGFEHEAIGMGIQPI